MEAAWLEGRIRQEFDKLREFLRVEEQAVLDAMAEEARQKQLLAEEKMRQLAGDTEALAQEIERLQMEMKEDDVSFLMVSLLPIWAQVQGPGVREPAGSQGPAALAPCSPVIPSLPESRPEGLAEEGHRSLLLSFLPPPPLPLLDSRLLSPLLFFPSLHSGQ